MLKRRFKLLLVILLVTFVLILAFLVLEHVRGDVSLARYRHQMISRGIKLDAPGFPRPPSENNGSPHLMAAVRGLRSGIILPTNYPPRMKLTPAGHAIVCFRENQWVDGKVTNHWEDLLADLATNATTLGQIREALEMPVLDNQLDFTQGARLFIPHLIQSKIAAQWFGAAGQAALHESRIHDAFEALTVQIKLLRWLQGDGIVISELVRVALASMARNGVWEALQSEPWSDDQLSTLQQLWTATELAKGMVHALEGELIFADYEFRLMRKSNAEIVGVLYGLEEYLGAGESNRPWWERTVRDLPFGESAADFLKKQVYCRIWSFAWLSQDECHYLQRMDKLLAIAKRAATAKSFSAASTELGYWQALGMNRNIYDGLRFPHIEGGFNMSSTVRKAMRAETERSMVICAIALRRYSLRYNRPARSLEILVPEFVGSVPIDFMDGKAMKYHLKSDGTGVLYSVGDDLKDDGGDSTLLPGKETPGSFWDRKDVVWPLPASPEEIESYRSKALE